jgi:hypothetical protein
VPKTTKTIRKVSGAFEGSSLFENSAKINGKFESEKIKQVSETNPIPLK